jgi:hypothetical protein
MARVSGRTWTRRTQDGDPGQENGLMAGKTTLGKPIQWKNLTRSLSIWQAPCDTPSQPDGTGGY